MRNLLIKLMFVVAMLSPTGCASDNMLWRMTPRHEKLDEDLVKYLHDYEKLFDENTQEVFYQYHLTGGFEDLPEEAAGVCWSFQPGVREIGFDLDEWAEATPIQRRFLVYHELTHCLCNRPHSWRDGKYGTAKQEDGARLMSRNGYFEEDGCPMSIMHPRMLTTTCAFAHYEEYLSEMRENCKP